MTITHSTLGRARRDELADFLRSRRERISPDDVGLPPGPRRRTPGLRREELAQLAGVGVTWYTWLEQGRPINASTQVLDAIARVLGLSRAEHVHLYRLADVPGWPDDDRPTCLTPEIQRVLDGMGSAAAVYDGKWDILACNAAYVELFPRLTTGRVRNALWHIFAVDPDACPIVNRDESVPKMVATLRAAFASHLDDPKWIGFVASLSAASPEFARLWASHDVDESTPRVKIFRNPETGEQVRMCTVPFTLPSVPEAMMVVYLPAEAGNGC